MCLVLCKSCVCVFVCVYIHVCMRVSVVSGCMCCVYMSVLCG